MNSTTRSVDLDLTPQEALELVREAAAPLRFREAAVEPSKGIVRWKRGFTLSSNPQDCTAAVEPVGDGRCTVTYRASVMALFDPFGFTRETAERFVHQLEAHRVARETGESPAAPPPARVGLVVNVVVLSLAGLMVVSAVGCGLGTVLLDGG
jgi:hypothetical protein